MKQEAPLERARRNVTEAEERIGAQQLHIVRLRDRNANAMAAAQLLDAMKGARRLARERLDREEAASRLSLWLQRTASPSIH